MSNLGHKRILLGVTGGIAAYKSADLIRRVREQGAEVKVVMTDAACEFITPLTLQALSGQPVHRSLLDENAEAAMGHIELARWADVILVAPCSADFMARLCHGLANDLLATLCLASTAPILLAPAMNQQMWQASVTQENAARLAERGIAILGPASGNQACGEVGPGRMLEPMQLLQYLNDWFESDLLSGRQVLVTAGPTREALDPVRFISNRSSGRMGYAIARAACEAGASVTLVSGPTALTPPERVRYVGVETAIQMRDAVMAHVHDTAIFISTAAVADYQASSVAEQKIKKQSPEYTLTLEKTPDILAEVAGLPDAPFTVGFAAETEQLSAHARSKLVNKNLNMIAANQVGDGVGFESDENALQVFWKEGNLVLERTSKDKIARQLIQVIADRYGEEVFDQDARSNTRH